LTDGAAALSRNPGEKPWLSHATIAGRGWSVNVTSDNEAAKVQAAELLLADAIRERDEAQARVDWLTSMVARYKGKPANGVLSSPYKPAIFGGEDDEPGYGSIKKAVLDILRGSPKRLKMVEIAAAFERAGLKSTAKTARASVRNAMKALLKEGKVRKVGSLHYKAVEKPEAQAGT
jgi:hypothetical protein